MTVVPYIWNRGSSFSFGLQVKSGAMTGGETLRVVMKAVPALYSPPPGDAAPEAVLFTPTFTPVQGRNLAHWLFSATAAQSELLTPGFYIADARIDLGGGSLIQVDPCYIQVKERVTEAS